MNVVTVSVAKYWDFAIFCGSSSAAVTTTFREGMKWIHFLAGYSGKGQRLADE